MRRAGAAYNRPRVTRSRVVLALLVLFAATLLVLPLTFGLPGSSTPDSVTDSGDAINQVYWVVFAVAAIVFLVVEVTLIAFIFRFRRRVGTPEHAEGPQIHGNTRVEVIWTLIPALALLGLAVYTFSRVPAVEAKPGGGEDALVVRVTAHQFYWEYEYPNGALSFDTLYLPVGRPVTLELRSADVNHSWWVPQLTGKRDAIPGQTNELHFTADETGTFADGVCGEFCGIQHARMTTRVEILSASDFEAWQADNLPPWLRPQGAPGADRALARLGEEEWRAACAKCHGFEGEGDIGPPIARNPRLRDRDALRTLLYEGQNDAGTEGFMPPTGKGWTDEQISALVAYVESNETLSGGEQGGG